MFVLQALILCWTQLHVSELLGEVLGVSRLVKLRLVWRRHLLIGDGLPVDAFEPGMILDVLSVSWPAAQSLVRVFFKQSLAEVFGVLAQEGHVQSWVSVFYIFIKLFSFLGVERRQAAKHFVDDCSK
jgi:hypothetical protein